MALSKSKKASSTSRPAQASKTVKNSKPSQSQSQSQPQSKSKNQTAVKSSTAKKTAKRTSFKAPTPNQKKPVVLKEAKRVSSRQIGSSSSEGDDEKDAIVLGSDSEADISIDLPARKPAKSAKPVQSARPKQQQQHQQQQQSPKSAGGRPKRLPSVPITAIPLKKTKPVRSGALEGMRYRSVVTHSSKLIRLAQNVFEQAAKEQGGEMPEAVVVEKAVFNPRAMHRKRIPWSAGEVA